jgi:hypothetical protein
LKELSRGKVLEWSLFAEATKGFGNVCLNQHATLIGDKRVGCIAGELVAQLQVRRRVSRESAGQ